MKIDGGKLSLVADLAGAYEPEVGVDQFTRRFEFTAPGEFLIEDNVKTEKDSTVTAYLHADANIVEKGQDLFEFQPDGTSLIAEILEPKNASLKVEKNLLITPGPPGNVDKGQREERGVRLAISTSTPVKEARFVVRLKIEH